MSESADAVLPAGAPDTLPALAALIAREVRPRFAVTPASFANRVRELAQAGSRDSGRSPEEHAAQLCLDDLYLASACLQNDEQAWRELAALHFDFMRSFARRFLPPAAARDTADEVIADLWTRGRLLKYEGRSTLRTWLGTVVAHAALNARKSMARIVPLEAVRTDSGIGASDHVRGADAADDEAAALLQQLFDRAVRRLDPEERVLLQLYYEQGLSLDALRLTLGVSSAAASRRLKGAREQLRAELEAICRLRAGEPADSLRAGIDLARIDLDLGKLFQVDARSRQDPVV